MPNTQAQLPGNQPHSNPKGWSRLEVSITTELEDALDELAIQEERAPEDILGRAITLYSLLSKASREGKHVGIATDSGSLETEVTGF
jgi:hypothetical protein